MRRIIVKEGPLVFLRNVLVMEFFAAAFFYAISFVENYEMIFNSWGLEGFIHYQTFVIIVFSLFQLAYIVVLFLNWYFSYYEVREKEVMRKSGLLFRHRKTVTMADVVSIEVYQSPLSRIMHHATLILEHRGGRVTKIRNISNFEEYAHFIKQLVHTTSGRLINRDIREMLAEGEGMFLEFKETLRYDARKGETSKELERVVMKSIVGFLNAEGGTLLIGVNDDGEVVGLENDYKILPKKNKDGFENHLNMLIKTMIGLSFAKYIGIEFEKVDGKEICVISVRDSHKPAYVRNGDKKEDFFVRVGNSTQPFSMSEAEEYIKSHWK